MRELVPLRNSSRTPPHGENEELTHLSLCQEYETLDGLKESLLSKAVDSGNVEMFETVQMMTLEMAGHRVRGCAPYSTLWCFSCRLRPALKRKGGPK